MRLRPLLAFIASLNCVNGLRCYSSNSYLDLSTLKLGPSMLVECPAKWNVSCTASYDPGVLGVLLRCSGMPCMLNGEAVNYSAVCREDKTRQAVGLATGASDDCCCYGDGCNRNVRLQNFLDAGVPVSVYSACSAVLGYPFIWANMEYSKKPSLPDYDPDPEDYLYTDQTTDLYPNGTVVTARCYKGHHSYYWANVLTSHAVRVSNHWSATCMNGNWINDGRTKPCEKLDDDDVVSGENEGSRKTSLSESIAHRIERFYDKASRPERTFLKRLIKGLDVEESSVGSSLY